MNSNLKTAVVNEDALPGCEVESEVPTIGDLPLVKAPRKPHKEKGAGLRCWQEKLVPLVLEACVRGENARVADLAKKVDMKSPNYVASALGQAVGGGLGMWKSGTDIRACQENVAIRYSIPQEGI